MEHNLKLSKILFLILLAVLYLPRGAFAGEQELIDAGSSAISVLLGLSPETNKEIAFFHQLVSALKDKGRGTVKIVASAGDGRPVSFTYDLKALSAGADNDAESTKNLYIFRLMLWRSTGALKISVANVDYNFMIEPSGIVFKNSFPLGQLPPVRL